MEILFMDKLIITNTSNDILIIQNVAFAPNLSYTVPDADITMWAKDAYLNILCRSGLCTITLYGINLSNPESVEWLRKMGTNEIMCS